MASCSPTLHFPSLHYVFQCVHVYAIFINGLPWDSHQTMTMECLGLGYRPTQSIGPLGPEVLGTAATCLSPAPIMGQTQLRASAWDKGTFTQPVRAIKWHK